jgi:hypothetical protein
VTGINSLFWDITRVVCYIPEDRTLLKHRWKNLKPHEQRDSKKRR